MITGIGRRWLLPALVAFGLLGLFFIGRQADVPSDAAAKAQNPEKNGILVVPIQLGRDSYGLAMVDTAEQTLWIYELNSRGPAYSRLKLWAARSWQYDGQLRQYNTDEPRPEQVKMLLEDLSLQRQKKPESQFKPILDVNVPEVNEPNKGGV
jgi:hypothetical protein